MPKHQEKMVYQSLVTLGSFFYHHKDNDLMDYELSLPSKYDGNLKTFCLYNKREFDLRLTEQQRQKLLEHHGKNMIIAALLTSCDKVSCKVWGEYCI